MGYAKNNAQIDTLCAFLFDEGDDLFRIKVGVK